MFIKVTKVYTRFGNITADMTLNAEHILYIGDGDYDVRIVRMRDGVEHRVQESHEYFRNIRRTNDEELVKNILDLVLQNQSTTNEEEPQASLPLEFRDPEVPIHVVEWVRPDKYTDSDDVDVDSCGASEHLDLTGI